MHNKDKYPEIWAAKQKAESELAPLMEARTLHTDAIKALQLKINDLQAQKVELNDQAMADADKIAELRSTIARCAIAMGAKVAGGL